MKQELLFYLPDKTVFVYAQEGSGDALTREDEKQGYDGYVDYTLYRFDCGEFEEVDGGILLVEGIDRFPEGMDAARWICSQMYPDEHTVILLVPEAELIRK